MTLEEAVKNNPTFINVPDTLIESAFITRGYEMTDDYTSTNLQELELISADLYLELATAPDFREGEMSVSFKRDILMRRASNIYFKYDDAKYDETGYSKLNLSITKK